MRYGLAWGKIVAFVGCCTGATQPTYGNLVDTAVDAARAGTSLGFTTEITHALDAHCIFAENRGKGL